VLHTLAAGFTYHDVTDDATRSGFQAPSAVQYKHSTGAFEENLNAIAVSTAPVRLVSQVNLLGRGKFVFLTFDDGGASACYIADRLEERGWRGHFFITTAMIGREGFVSAGDLRDLASRGHVVGAHSHTHPRIFRDLPRDKMLTEWTTSIEILEDLLGETVTAASIPGGEGGPVVERTAAEAGIRHLFTSEPRLRPRRVSDGCVSLGRACPRATTPASRVGALARFRGWHRERLVRSVKQSFKVLAYPLFQYRANIRPLVSDA
jgi:peptidoglycan/xylan/chitin deacetylase (PgdA/CDA1 family)